MTFKPGKKFFEAVLNLQGDVNFDEVKKEFQAYHLEAGIQFPRLNGEALIKLQGSAALVLEWLACCDPNFARAELDHLKQLENQTTKIPY